MVADVAELADALDSKSSIREDVWVRPPPSAPNCNRMASIMHARVFPAFVLAISLRIAAATCPAQDEHWVGTWGDSPQLTETRNLPPTPGLTSNTLRQVVHVSIGAGKLRARFSNAFGTTPVTMNSAHIALSAGASVIRPETDKPLTFQGKPDVMIPAGDSVISDAIDFNLAPLCDVALTICFGGTSEAVTGHPGSRTTSFLEAGDQVSAADLPNAAQTQHWYILTGIDVLAGSLAARLSSRWEIP